MKSLQFRNIAPKAPAAVPSASPALLSCQPPSALPEASTASSPKSIIVPAQNYALMQIAGQDGTFSLVALPPSVSSQTPQQQTAKNLKLPIPRYQASRSKGTPDKAKTPPTAKAKTMPKAVGTQTKLLPKVPKEEPSDQLLSMDQASSDLSVTALLPENAVLYPGSQLEPKADPSQCTPTPGLVQNLQYPSPGIKTSPGKPPEESKTSVKLCQSKPAGQPSGSITVLSPAIFSKAVQIIPSPPKGKLPILPYSKIKNSLMPTAKLSSVTTDKNKFAGQPLLSSPTDSAPKTPVPETMQPPQVQTALVPIIGTVPKAPGRKRGRKRKTLEDILAFEARKKRSLTFFRRRVPDKPPAAAPNKQKEVDISKKYRSIRPKPLLLMETVPQLVSMPTLAAESQDKEVPPGQQTASPPAPAPLPSRLHRCPTCSRSFQFKHHLQSHMNSHTNNRPYACPMCRKAYAHSGSLSTHMKLHHAEVRPRTALSCEFCQKAFGYVGVYFSHLREVHRVVLTVEPSISQHEDQPHADGTTAEGGEEAREDPVELQIKCGRCQAITPTFADMKMHLRHVHGEELPVSQDQAPRSGREAEDELVKHAAHYWRQLNHKRNLVKCGRCDEEFFSFSKLKRHVMSHHQSRDGQEGGGLSPDSEAGLGILSAQSGLNCVLCREVLDSRDSLLEHWSSRHHCEQPGLLWDALSSYSGQEELDVDTPHPSPH
ncbi:zinc finger protein 438 [Boleophthalmus pectinirostris]|uniref:zinc finger protein 438 n=1 Tax=Boleophthalmus pectinirostris TaxID=150288 RepID=UPI000A1C6DBE|nr:zinc finger protein 438 [Boleophthalmus pectinirostris]XP_055007077.1 zinc finger protein 438 [Boleophthalmus pectinirostris]